MTRTVTTNPTLPSGPSRQVRRWFLTVFSVVFLAGLVLGMFDTLVWLPQHVAPSVPLHRIYRVLADVGSATRIVAAPVLWLVFWAAAGVTFVALLWPTHHRRRIATSASTPTVTGIGLVVLGAMAFFQWGSAFAMGMEVSDEVPPYTGGITPLGLLYFGGGAVLILLGGAVWLTGKAHSSRPHVRVTGD